MAVITNTTTTSDVVEALNVQAALNFSGEYDKLAEILGIVAPEVVAAGTALYQLQITGTLNASQAAEGDEVPLSKYAVTKKPVGAVELKKYRKMTSAEAILKSGYEVAIMKTDAKMLTNVRADIMAEFFGFMEEGTTTATGTGLQAALANADAQLQVKLEANGDEGGAFVHFVNPLDVAAYIGNAPISTNTAFGMTYLQDFLGIQNVVVTAKVAQGTFFVTPAENIHMYGVDFGALAQAGLAYDVQAGSLIGVAHEAEYGRASAETHVVTGATLFAEVLDYIVKGTVAPAA